MEIIRIQSDNCGTCQSNTPSRNNDVRICDTFNIPVIMFLDSTQKYGCNSYTKDVNKMERMFIERKIHGKDYILWDTQFSESNARMAAEIILDRVPKSDPHIAALHPDQNDSPWGVYVLKEMSDD